MGSVRELLDLLGHYAAVDCLDPSVLAVWTEQESVRCSTRQATELVDIVVANKHRNLVSRKSVQTEEMYIHILFIYPARYSIVRFLGHQPRKARVKDRGFGHHGAKRRGGS